MAQGGVGERPKVLLVDGNNILMRSIMAMGNREVLATEEGVPTGPLLTYINMLASYVRQVSPDILVTAWDAGSSKYRLALYPGYKENRGRSPDDGATEVGVIKIKDISLRLAEVFSRLANIPYVSVPGYEADDIIARYVVGNPECDFTIVSGDKDLLQLIDFHGKGTCSVIRPGIAGEAWGTERFLDEVGCEPRHWPLVMALAGDSSDGIPGVPRVGVKTAIKDLSASGWSIDGLIKDGPQRYADHGDLISIFLRLVDLRSGESHPDVPKVSTFSPTGPDSTSWPDLRGFLVEMELRSILPRYELGNFWSGTR